MHALNGTSVGEPPVNRLNGESNGTHANGAAAKPAGVPRADHAQSLRRSLLRAAYQTIEVLSGGPPSEPIRVVISASGAEITFTSEPGEFEGRRAADLPPAEAHILAVLTDDPQDAKVVARLSKYSVPYVRRALSLLCGRELVEHVPGKGYRLRA